MRVTRQPPLCFFFCFFFNQSFTSKDMSSGAKWILYFPPSLLLNKNKSIMITVSCEGNEANIEWQSNLDKPRFFFHVEVESERKAAMWVSSTASEWVRGVVSAAVSWHDAIALHARRQIFIPDSLPTSSLWSSLSSHYFFHLFPHSFLPLQGSNECPPLASLAPRTPVCGDRRNKGARKKKMYNNF